MLRRLIPGVGLPRGHDIVRVVRVREGLAVCVLVDVGAFGLGEAVGEGIGSAVRRSDLAVRDGELRRNCAEFLLGKQVAQAIVRAVRRFEGGVGFLRVERLHRGRLVDLRDRREVFELRGVGKRQADKDHGGGERADQDKRRAPAETAVAAVGDRAEQRQKEQRQHVVQRHHAAGGGLRQAELVRQNERDRVVIRLPEGADQEKCEADKDRPLIV